MGAAQDKGAMGNMGRKQDSKSGGGMGHMEMK
jgi:hypothetical protein